MQSGYYSCHTSDDVGLYLVLPDSHDSPAGAPETAKVSLVTPAISFDLFSPKRLDLVSPARVAKAVPEIAIDENGEPFSCEDQIRTSSEFPDVLAKAESPLPQRTGNRQFDVGTLLANLGHEAAALFGCQSIHGFFS